MSSQDESLAIRNFRPRLKIDTLLGPFYRFLDIEASGGILLLLATLAALFMANTSLVNWYNSIWATEIKLSLGESFFTMSLLHLVNDGLMTIFFFVVGLEIKREIVRGELRSLKSARFPILAAIGGMLMPAAIFALIEGRGLGARGWAIPMATDIAFVVGFLSLLGKRVPHNLKIALLTLAIADDIGAILVIAIFYAKSVHFAYLAAALVAYGAIFLLNFLGVRRVMPYAIAGFAMWCLVLGSGIHPTISGVLLGLATPATRLLNSESLRDFLARFQKSLDQDRELSDRESLRAAGHEANSPLDRLETDLHPWVSYLIMPLFAFANAGVPVQLSALESGLAWAVILGLLVGKPLGIFALIAGARKLRWLELPESITPRVFLAASCLAGVGFTMSLFIAGLALDGELLMQAKVGILVGSALSACLGLFLLNRFLDRRERPAAEAPAAAAAASAAMLAAESQRESSAENQESTPDEITEVSTEHSSIPD